MTEQPGAERKPGEEETPEPSGQAAPESGTGSSDPWEVGSERPEQSGQPEQPAQPRWGQPEQPAQPQWGQPEQPAQPQWGQPEQPAQPQWGQPEQPAQPQWGQPGQGGQPGQWGQPQQGQPQQGPPPQWGQPGQPGQQWGQPGYYPGYGPPQTEQGAIWALVSAIGSFVVCPVVLAVVALVLASNADKKIKASGGALQGDGMVVAARVIAWANIILLVGGFLLLLVVGVAASTN